MSKRLSYSQKRMYLELLIKRDGGYRCFYCEKKFGKEEHPIFEHLNNNSTDNRLDNLVLSHQSCNIKKIDDVELSRKADEKLEQNQREIYVGEKDLNKILSKNSSKTELPKEIDINTKNYDVVRNYLDEQTQSLESIEFKDTLNSCVYLCKVKTGHGSHQCVRNYIHSLTSSVGPYELIKEGKKRLIQSRTNS